MIPNRAPLEMQVAAIEKLIRANCADRLEGIWQRFVKKIEFTDNCWLWRGNHRQRGYGLISFDDRKLSAHKMALAFFLGTHVPSGMVTDHLCGNRRCINPAHLSLITRTACLAKHRFSTWKGDDVNERSGRARALKMYPEIGPCVVCGNPRSERHHIDGNTRNNDASNIRPLCRRCHMREDGRMDKFREVAIASLPLAQAARWPKSTDGSPTHGHIGAHSHSRGHGGGQA